LLATSLFDGNFSEKNLKSTPSVMSPPDPTQYTQQYSTAYHVIV